MIHKKISFFWKKYKFRSIVVKNSFKLFIIFALILILPICGIYSVFINNTRKQVIKENITANRKIAATVEALLRDSEYLISEMFTDNDVSYFLALRNDMNYSEEERHSLYKKINAFKSGKTLIDSIYVYLPVKGWICSNMNFSNSVNEFGDTSWIDEYNTPFPEGYKIISRKTDNTSKKVFTIIKKNPNNTGGIVINIDLDKLRKYIPELAYGGDEFYIVNDRDVMYTNVISSKRIHEQEKKVVQMIAEGESDRIIESANRRISVVAEKSQYYEWSYIRMYDVEDNEKLVSSIFYKFIALLILFMIIIIVCSVVLSINNVSQVITLLDLFENRDMYRGLSENEISEIASKIIVLMDDNEKLEKEIKIRNSEYDSMMMKALQTQITPHFLNNTLAVINYEAIEEFNGENRISMMLSKLSRILEYTLVSDRILVLLREELEYIKNYIELLKLRYGDFEVNIEVDDDVLDVVVLRMCMQPMIENAVFHGLKKKGGRLSIICKRTDTGITICIEDDGKGIEPEEIKALMESFESDSMNEENVGLKNVYKRMKIIFAENSDLRIESKKGEYTRIILEMPYNTE